MYAYLHTHTHTHSIPDPWGYSWNKYFLIAQVHHYTNHEVKRFYKANLI